MTARRALVRAFRDHVAALGRSAGHGVSAVRARGYSLRGRRPWAFGYADFKMAAIRHALRDHALLDAFRAGERLPPGYGARLDERIVEYPWALSRLLHGPSRLLDAGSALNHGDLLGAPILRGKDIHIVTLAPEPRCYWQAGISYLFADLRLLPLRDEYYDEIVSISTLEHVGCDNSLYRAGTGSGEGDFRRALDELRRVLRPGGALFFTVPFGRRTDMGWQRQFDRSLLDAAIETFRPARLEQAFYGYADSGWQVATADAVADAEYFDVRNGIGRGADFAAAARAVACVRMWK